MANNKKDPVLVVLQLSGGNDYHNSVVPYANPLYWDYRPTVRVPEDQVLHLDDKVGFHPNMGPLRDIYNAGNMAIIHGVGYANSIRSHFRSMDIWHTCEPDKIGTEGWLGRALRDIDPNKENVVTGVSFGTSMFRAMAVPGVPVASIADLDNYGLLTGMVGEEQRARALETFTRAYSPAIGTGPVMEYLGQTGLDAMKGADILKVAPGMYSLYGGIWQYPHRQEPEGYRHKYIWPTWELESTTATMVALIPTLTRTLYMPSSGRKCQRL